MSTQRGNKNSDAIRILQRDRDASARATHLKAEIGMVPNSTIERKIMSTKTSIKRIALVAAAALTLGGFSVITASTANAANEGVSGVAFSSSKVFTGTASTTVGSIAAPVALTMIANSTVYLDVVETATPAVTPALAVGSLSTFADTATLAAGSATATLFGYASGATVAGTSISTTDTVTSLTAPQTTGTYYVQISATNATNRAYAVITVVNALATTYDGTVGGIGSAAVSAVAGSGNAVNLTVARHTTTTGKAGFITVSGSGATIASIATVAQVVGTVSGKVATSAEDTVAVVINTPTAGTVTVTYAPESAAGSLSAGSVTDTIVITVNATGSSGVLSTANSTLYDTDTVGGTAVASLTAPTALATAGTARLSYTWSLKDALKAAYSLSPTTLGSVTITGPGLLAATSSSASAAKALSINTGSYGNFYLFGDGTSGVATVTFSVGATVVGTKTVTFYSSTVKTLTTTVNHGVVNAAAVTGFMADTGTGTAGTVSFVSVVASDASGNAIPSLTNLTATSSSTSIATVGTPTWDSTDLVYYVPVTGVASGAATITVKDSTATISATASIKVAKAVISTMTVAFGATSYNAGDAATLTITAKDSNGDAVADGYYNNALAAAASVSQALTSTLFGTQLHFVSGVATAKFFAPYNGGVLTANVYAGSSTTVLASALQLEASAVAHTATATITAAGGGDASLAYDAASAATDAANNAYEEAQNATQAASDALAAVKALAVQVKALIALVNKIKAKLKA